MTATDLLAKTLAQVRKHWDRDFMGYHTLSWLLMDVFMGDLGHASMKTLEDAEQLLDAATPQRDFRVWEQLEKRTQKEVVELVTRARARAARTETTEAR